MSYLIRAYGVDWYQWEIFNSVENFEIMVSAPSDARKPTLKRIENETLNSCSDELDD